MKAKQFKSLILNLLENIPEDAEIKIESSSEKGETSLESSITIYKVFGEDTYFLSGIHKHSITPPQNKLTVIQ